MINCQLTPSDCSNELSQRQILSMLPDIVHFRDCSWRQYKWSCTGFGSLFPLQFSNATPVVFAQPYLLGYLTHTFSFMQYNHESCMMQQSRLVIFHNLNREKYTKKSYCSSSGAWLGSEETEIQLLSSVEAASFLYREQAWEECEHEAVWVTWPKEQGTDCSSSIWHNKTVLGDDFLSPHWWIQDSMPETSVNSLNYSTILFCYVTFIRLLYHLSYSVTR